MGLSRYAGLFLRGQRRLDELPQQGLGQIRRDLQPLGGVAAPQYDLSLSAEVARRAPGGPLNGGHLFAQCLASGHQFQQLAVEISQCRS